jgi:hypothetical protein
MIAVRVYVEPLDRAGLSHRDRLTILRGQITLLRCRCEADLAVTIDALARAERLARSLESEELAA